MGKISYNYGNPTPLLPPILRRVPDLRDPYTKFLENRKRWLIWHIRIAVRQRDSQQLIKSVKKIQKEFRTFNYKRKLIVARVFQKKYVSHISNLLIGYLNIINKKKSILK